MPSIQKAACKCTGRFFVARMSSPYNHSPITSQHRDWNHLNTLPTAGLIIVRHRALLLAYSNNKQAWYLPGGKIDAGETAKQALLREIHEELALNLDAEQLHFYTHISAPAYGETPAVMMAQDCFRAELGDAIPQAQAEIGAVRYFTLAEFQQLDIQVAGVVQVYACLQADGLV